MRLRIISDGAWMPPRLAPAPKREFNIFQLNRLGRMVQHAVGGPCLRRRGRGRVRSWAVIEYINTYLASDLSVTELAGVACLSPYHFGKMFKRSMGRTIHQFVTDRRIERAKSLLKSTPLNLLEIAAIVAFLNRVTSTPFSSAGSE